MSFFDSTDHNDLRLLRESVRSDSDISWIAEQAERDVIVKFRVRTGENTYEIYLEGYDDTTPDNSNADLKEALRRAIARVIDHRLAYKNRDPALRREKLADYEYETVAGGALSKLWPDGWEAELVEFFSEKAPWYTI